MGNGVRSDPGRGREGWQVGESNGGKVGTIVIEQLYKKKHPPMLWYLSMIAIEK